jgi:hypothetical protein
MSLSHPINPSENRLARPRILIVATIGAALLVISNAGALLAQAPSTSPRNPPTSCANDPERHRFDFWLGEWDVTTRGGTKVGSSVIQSVSKGCALLENWTSAKGGQGKSLNAFNPAIRQWQQFWIGADGLVTEYRSSSYSGRSLIFTVDRGGGSDSTYRLTFTPIDSLTVRQHSEASADGGKSWLTQYDFYYHRKTR